jgi:16S rRNA (guanine966-N2)-methyltransferase
MVRIIAGEFRSRQLLTLRHDESTRPVLSRVKESMFSMLHEWFENARVLDLFAGVGTIGLEAVSRGAADVLMVEKSLRTFRILQQNVERLGCGDRARTLHGDALGRTCLLEAPQPADLVFVDPPYAMMEDARSRQRILDQAARCRAVMADKSFLVLRSPRGPDDFDLALPGFIGPEPHRYRKDMWVLLYEPQSKPRE